MGAVQRLLQKLENNDEKEIINNLKEANKFEDYEHLLELDSDDSDDEVDRMLKREEEKIENQEEGAVESGWKFVSFLFLFSFSLSRVAV